MSNALRPVSGPIWHRLASAVLLAAIVLAPAGPAQASDGEPRHGIAIHGGPKYPANFVHFDYSQPDASKGGTLRLGAGGTFDSLNPFVVRGSAPRALRQFVYESLMTRSWDEPFSLYGLIAETIAVAPDRSSVTFRLRPEARFSDRTPIRAEDVAFSWQLLRDKGLPNFGAYYRKVARVDTPDARTVVFHLDAQGQADRELPMVLGLMSVLPAHAIDPDTFADGGLTPFVGSGPYTVAAVDPGRRLVFRRDPGYWARDLAVTRGRFNFDRIVIDYFRDENTRLEAFKTGATDLWAESDVARWLTHFAHEDPAALPYVAAEIPHGRPSGLEGFVFNTRRAAFRDWRVRKALTLLLDRAWIANTFYAGAMRPTHGLFDNTDMAGTGPATDEMVALLAATPGLHDPAVIADGYQIAMDTLSGSRRKVSRAARQLLAHAGFAVENGAVVDPETGAPFRFEILLGRPQDERLALAYAGMLRDNGIEAQVRLADAAQYTSRRQSFDFDMILDRWIVTLSPGNEQEFYWGSGMADQQGSRNYAGVRDPAIDRAVAALVAAETRNDLVTAARALDRLIMAGHYVAPLFHTPVDRVAYARRLGLPDRHSLYGYQTETWWVETRD